MKTEKKCKGHGKALHFEGCGKLVQTNTRRYGLCPKCFFKWMTETTQGKIHYEKQFISKARKNMEKREKEKANELKNKLTDWPTKLVDKCQEIARLIDHGQPCLARGNHPKQMHGGHVFSKGSNPSMKFNLHNIHRQGAQSNHFQADDTLLREGLVREYGQEYFDFISGMRAMEPLKLSRDEYHEAYKRACEVANKYRRAGKTFTAKERMEERTKVNMTLGVYPLEYH